MGIMANNLSKLWGNKEREIKRELSEEQKEINKAYDQKVLSLTGEKKQKPLPEYDYLKKLWWKNAQELASNVGKEMIIDEGNEDFIKMLLYYFAGDQEKFAQHGSGMIKGQPSLTKGLYIAGSYGFGKSLSMIAMRKALQGYQGSFAYRSTVEIVAQLDKESHIDYTRGTYFFDDLGQEKKHYGREVFADLLFQRYDLFRSKGKKTHLTSNMGLSEIQERYGQYISSRFFEMFNIIYVTGKDRRR